MSRAPARPAARYAREEKRDSPNTALERVCTMRQEDPAEHDGSRLRYLYRSWRPTLYGRMWTRIYAWLTGLGVLPRILVCLETQDCRSSRPVAHVLVPVAFEGDRYLVSMLGEQSGWVRDIRAANGTAFLKRGRKYAVRLVEIPPGHRAPILKAWCRIATSGRRHIPVAFDASLTAFEAIAGDYPVFRIDPA